VATLDRRIGLGLLTLYGVGVMVGAGIYVLVGQIAGLAGSLTPVAFLIAGAVAGCSAYAFAELSARIPESAGEAAFVEEAFGSALVSLLVGLAVVSVGVISAAAIVKGSAGYLLDLVALPRTAVELGLVVLLAGLASAGVVTSLSAAAVFTLLEIGGLLAVAVAGFLADPVGSDAAVPMPAVSGLGAGALLAFFAFVGFEDMVNMAEETRSPTRTMPRAIFLAVAITTALYVLVSVAALRVVPPALLAATERPLAVVFEAGSGLSPVPITAIAIVATLNGVLVQIVMAARVLYGLGRRRRSLRWFHSVNAVTRTPLRGTAVAAALISALVLAAPIDMLARLTAFILLIVFSLVNAALIVLKRRGPPPAGAPNAPLAVPVAGIVLALGLLGWSLWT
jgi:amino acid transporter